jgi:hypothetical protein
MRKPFNNHPVGTGKLGFTRDGHQIVARGCGEDNSGVCFYIGVLGVYRIMMNYPVDWCDEFDNPIYHLDFQTQSEAVSVFKSMLGGII